MTVRPAFRPPLQTGGHEAGTLVLRDGSRLTLLRALGEDARQIAAFLERLPEAEQREVRQSLRLGPAEVEDFLERLAREAGEAFFVASDGEASDGRIVAFGAYHQRDGENAAALGLAVDPTRRQMGIASLLLERRAVLAARRGVARLVGIAHATNASLIDLFRQGGFVSEEKREGELLELSLDTRSAVVAAEREGMASRIFAAASLQPLFHPRSVAVVGASRTPGTVGHSIVDALVRSGFNGPVFPVNPKAGHVGSIKAYSTLEAIGEPIDLAVIAVPAAAVEAVVDSCAALGVQGLVVITAGFAEIGADGRERQRRLLEKVRAHGMRMVGPNCLGLIATDPDVSLNASFAPQMPPAGDVALCSQSGALGVAIIALTRRLGLGLSSFVSVGNKADISGNDLLEYWEEDPRTRVVLF